MAVQARVLMLMRVFMRIERSAGRRFYVRVHVSVFVTMDLKRARFVSAPHSDSQERDADYALAIRRNQVNRHPAAK
jgi:hypothetical protein